MNPWAVVLGEVKPPEAPTGRVHILADDHAPATPRPIGNAAVVHRAIESLARPVRGLPRLAFEYQPADAGIMELPCGKVLIAAFAPQAVMRWTEPTRKAEKVDGGPPRGKRIKVQLQTLPIAAQPSSVSLTSTETAAPAPRKATAIPTPGPRAYRVVVPKPKAPMTYADAIEIRERARNKQPIDQTELMEANILVQETRRRALPSGESYS